MLLGILYQFIEKYNAKINVINTTDKHYDTEAPQAIPLCEVVSIHLSHLVKVKCCMNIMVCGCGRK